VPATLTTKCAFGGPALEDLYVTTATRGLDAQARAAQPLAGGLFRLRPGVRGQPVRRFAG
jgi:sugar lactone lactonase YvrE